MISKGFCYNFANLTFIWLDRKFGGLAVLDEKTQKFSGDFSGLVEYLLGTKRCRLVSEFSMGTEYFNGTHTVRTGAIKLMHEKVSLSLVNSKPVQLSNWFNPFP